MHKTISLIVLLFMALTVSAQSYLAPAQLSPVTPSTHLSTSPLHQGLNASVNLSVMAGFGKGGTVDVGLCGNTADVQARAADVLTFEDGDLQALFGSIFSGAVATWPRTDDDEISCCH